MTVEQTMDDYIVFEICDGIIAEYSLSLVLQLL